MDKRYIIALEIGSSKIKGLAASVSDLGNIDIIAVEETKVNNCVRYGKIQNIQEVSAHVNDIIRKLENNLRISPRKITDVFIALGGRTLATAAASAHATFPNPVEISADTIGRLKRDASFGLVTDKKTLDILPKAFFVDNSEVKNVVGTVGSSIKAQFTAIVVSPTIPNNIELIKFDNPGIKTHYVVRPTAIADLVLSASERQLGCTIVDLGAETTTISVYKDNALQLIVTLPIGSRNITRDLMTGLNMTEERAELAKAVNGSATIADAPAAADAEVINYISARAGEIVANIIHQLDAAGFKPQTLPKGIILTGGGAQLRNISRLIENQAKMPVRIAAIENSLQFKSESVDLAPNIDIIAIAKNAAETTTISCLETPTLQTTIEVGSTNHNETHINDQRHNRRPIAVDDKDLMNDDPDDLDTTTRPTPQPIEQNDSIEEPEEQEEPDDTTPSLSMVESLKLRFTNFLKKSAEDDSDLDEKID